MFLPDILLDDLTRQIRAAGHAVPPIKSGTRYHYTQCSACKTPYWIARYSGIYSPSLRAITTCVPNISASELTDADMGIDPVAFATTINAPMLSTSKRIRTRPRAHATDPTTAPQTICAYCGSGTTLVGARCKHCQRLETASFNPRAYTVPSPYITVAYQRYMYIGTYTVSSVRPSTPSTTSTPSPSPTSPHTTMRCPSGDTCTHAHIYVPYDLAYASTQNNAVPYTVFECAHRCGAYGAYAITVALQDTRALGP